ncbi:MAG: hypothetical protein UDC04_06860 [Collinsella bouchesdurhonensis]|nr:hypothetical protein [Collinsella bouchesdurhonensis]
MSETVPPHSGQMVNAIVKPSLMRCVLLVEKRVLSSRAIVEIEQILIATVAPGFGGEPNDARSMLEYVFVAFNAPLD